MTAKKNHQQKKRRLNPILSKTDLAVLEFLWHHRITSFQGLRHVFYPSETSERAYYQLRRLRRGEFVRVEMLDGTRNKAWCLDKRGYQYAATHLLPELAAKTYKPQRAYHDAFVTAALLGDWARERPKNVRIVTEQELVALDLGELPKELRKEREHQPDGLWVFGNDREARGIALEVELTGKSSARYEQICAYYTGQFFFEHVVWIVGSKALGSRILADSRRYGMPRDGVHLFVLQETFERDGWQSKFLNRSTGTKTLAELLREKASGAHQTGDPLRVRLESAMNPPTLPVGSVNPFLDFSFSLENLDTLRAEPRPKNP